MSIFQKGGKWYIDYYYEGRRIREVAGSNKRQAEIALTARRGEILQGRFNLESVRPSPLFEKVMEEYSSWAAINKRSWWFAKTSRIPPLDRYFKGKTLRTITPWIIEKYKAHRRKTVKPATVNRELALLSHFFTKAIEWGHAKDHPMKGGKVKKLPGEVMRERILNREEEDRLLAEASPDLRPVLILALDTGMRFGEIIGLEWERVDLVQGDLLISQSKSGRPRRIPLSARVHEALQKIRERCGTLRPEGPVFSRQDGKQIRSVREAFDGAKKRAGLLGLRFHDLRHTFATRLVTGGVDIVTVQRLLGHLTLAMTQRYTHPTSADMNRAIEVLNRHQVVRDGHHMDTIDSGPSDELNLSPWKQKGSRGGGMVDARDLKSLGSKLP